MRKRQYENIAVSYTHLDVYKRQKWYNAANIGDEDIAKLVYD